jgi:hypothetical protein
VPCSELGERWGRLAGLVVREPYEPRANQ